MAGEQKKRRKRTTRPFPACSFEEAALLGNAIQKQAAGNKVRRLTLFDGMQKSPDSGTSRQLITNSSKYGITKGSYQADFIEFTPGGKKATDADLAPSERLEARIELAVKRIEPFHLLYEQYKGNKLPNQTVMRDHLLENGISEEFATECVETFIVNAKFLGLLQTVAGAERIITIDHLLEQTQNTVPQKLAAAPPGEAEGGETEEEGPSVVVTEEREFSRMCFYITPIGDEGSEQRRHSDLFLGSIVEPALEDFDLKVISADKISKPGMITAQVIDCVIKAKLVVGDLSFHNPNVFYELSLRHACRLPTVHIIRAEDKIPFDLDQFRTVKIDCADIYTFVPKLETYRAEISAQARRALHAPGSVDNPISVFCPTLSVSR